MEIEIITKLLEIKKRKIKSAEVAINQNISSRHHLPR